MLDLRRNLIALATSVAVLLLAGSAHALSYFDGPSGFGFDNSTLLLSPDYLLTPSTPGYVASGVTDPSLTDLGLLSVDTAINDTATSIDRTITWTLINNAPATLTDFIIVFTALGPSSSSYASANIDLDIDGFDPMVIMNLQLTDLFWFAGYRLTSADFDSNQMATRTFRYTVDVGEGSGGPPELGIMYMTEFTVPEPATGLLFGGALLMAVGAGRRRTS